MSWRQAIRSFLYSGTVISMAGGLVITGAYVIYKDRTRYPRMMDAYARGNILPPMAENNFETVYFSRPGLEQVRCFYSVNRPLQYKCYTKRSDVISVKISLNLR